MVREETEFLATKLDSIPTFFNERERLDALILDTDEGKLRVVRELAKRSQDDLAACWRWSGVAFAHAC